MHKSGVYNLLIPSDLIDKWSKQIQQVCDNLLQNTLNEIASGYYNFFLKQLSN